VDDTLISLLENPEFLKAPQVAELLSLPVSWVREQTRRGLIPHHEFGKYRRYRREEILA
jgi:excisionase family DNA binding protein